MALQPHLQTNTLAHTPECYQYNATRSLTWQAYCRCGKLLRGSTRKILAANQKRHYTICTARTYHTEATTNG